MTVFNSQMIYLGNFADVDPTEGNTNSENAADLLGKYSGFTIENVQVDDADSDGQVLDDEFGETSETVSYDLGAGPQTQLIDSTNVYNASIKLADGSIVTTPVTVIQMQNGDVFLTEFVNDGSIDGLTIRNVTLDSVFGSNYGSFVADSSYDSGTVVCFAHGTQIMTPDGPVAVEALQVGQLVDTMDHGAQPIRWIGAQTHPDPGQNAPIRIGPDALGQAMPAAPLYVSPQHRVLVRNKVAQRMFGEDEILVAAKALLGTPGVTQASGSRTVRYWHFACDRHEMILANGTWAETLLPGKMAMRALPDAQRRELSAILPATLRTGGAPAQPCRPCPPMRRQRRLFDRLCRNDHHTIVASAL
ncbi:Hint domain-containing protein [Tateyamaria sp. SN6-1]|uniref:Hint domain-containing protein n=1 Tax=Tateyamaria sp. SN6-1 TaxID=3092148 RepID=UPI0039F56506